MECLYGCNDQALGGPRHRIRRIKVASDSVLAACEHGAWFEQLSPKDLAARDLMLNGAGVGLREYARGRAVLHGAAVAFSGTGLSIVGPARVGKSTLAAWLCAHGWSFISDAMTVVEPESRLLIGQAARFRLFDDSIRALGKCAENLPLDDTYTKKRRLDVTSLQRATSATQLECVCLLEPGDRLSIARESPAQAVMLLLSQSYLVSRFDRSESGHLMSLAGKIVNAGTRVYTMKCPPGWPNLEDARAALEALITNK